MNFSIIKEDFKKNKLINVSIIIFIAISATLITFALLMTVNLVGSIDNLMEKAKTPDFLQMHVGEINLKNLEIFSKSTVNVKDYQTLEYLNIEGDKIEINNISQDKTIEDLGLVYQSEKFDYLLDFNNQIIEVEEGEIYLPIIYFKEGYANIGDFVSIYDKSFTIKGFFRDSQMNSSLAGSKRILLNEKDFDFFRDKGKMEYLIEFRLNDRSKMTAFEKDYFNSISEKNGPVVTYAMFKMINGLNEGLFIALLLLASFLILIISFLCIRFTLLAKIEDEYREIGVMKAIGIKSSEIKNHYLSQYLFMNLIGLVFGYSLALVFQEKLLNNIHLYMGENQLSRVAPLFSILGILFLFVIIVLYINGVLNKVKKITPVQAIRDGGATHTPSSERRISIENLGFINVNLAIAISDLYARKSQYLTILFVVILSTSLIILPQNINNTISNSNFTTYMGIGQIDLSLEISQDLYSPKKEKELTDFFNNESNISKYTVIKTNDILVKLPSGDKAYIKTSFGDHQTFPIRYSRGHGPKKDNEIALTSLYMDDLGLKIGDHLTLSNGQKISVVGEYSDISNGGKTAKALFPTNHDKTKLTYYLLVKNKNKITEVSQDYNTKFPEAKIVTVREYIDQSFGSLIHQINNISIAMLVVCLLVISLITLLFARLLIAKDKKQISILVSLGFKNSDISKQFIYRFICLLILAIPIAILLSNTFGTYFAAALLSSFGIKSMRFVVNPLTIYLIIPLAIILVTTIASKLATLNISHLELSNHIKE